MMEEIVAGISLNRLRDILKNEVKKISLTDMHELSVYFQNETRFLPEDYKREYVNSVQTVLLSRLTSLRNDTCNYDGEIEEDDVKLINELLERKDNNTQYILNITVIYARYFLNEPVHNINTIIPGPKKVYKKGKYYYCPMKKYHITNNKSVCKYCIAKIEEE
ncbi:DUF2115 family protein [Methanosphaera sp. ISO3-F5]|uniref:DUF2115 family protein n=1 Tax=Methanosphaera sp. ISO3-F5 TaxID=1452353 RepID=UPI002B25AEC7|nr:DUF2115 family protein [Methanosphaera sp. ISO3-F5]WQH65009.1 DUF2115 family protein [Methanosphaera sp. ISO3-F5]